MNIYERVSTQEKVDFTRNLALLVKSGTTINEAFSLLAKQSRNPALKRVFEKGKNQIEEGTPIYKVFEEEKHFDNVFVSFIRAGEESGTLEESLKFLADWMDKQNTLSKEISAATLYPKIIIVFAILMGGGLSIFILPQLVSVFDGMDIALPLPTRILLAFTEFMENYGLYYVVPGAVALGAGYFFMWRWERAKRIADVALLRIPVIGGLQKDYQLTIISYLASLLFKSGLTVSQTLDIVLASVTNTQYSDSLRDIRDRVKKGTHLSEALNRYPSLYPEIFVSVVYTGESSGSYEDSFDYLSVFFWDRVTNRTKRLPVVLEPTMLIGIGLMVGFIALAIILPVYEVTKAF